MYLKKTQENPHESYVSFIIKNDEKVFDSKLWSFVMNHYNHLKLIKYIYNKII